MEWFSWVLVAWFGLNAIAGIGYIGRDRGKIAPSTAVITTVIYFLLILGVITQ